MSAFGKIKAQARMAVMAGVDLTERDLLNPYKNEFAHQWGAGRRALLWDEAFIAEYKDAERVCGLEQGGSDEENQY